MVELKGIFVCSTVIMARTVYFLNFDVQLLAAMLLMVSNLAERLPVTTRGCSRGSCGKDSNIDSNKHDADIISKDHLGFVEWSLLRPYQTSSHYSVL